MGWWFRDHSMFPHKLRVRPIADLNDKREQALQNWGSPTTATDITALFLRYLTGEASSTPWSDEPLQPETVPITPHLTALNSRGWWTVGSQPALDAVSSDDEVYGWGPKGGYVFQKAFVEFFCTKEDVAMLEERIRSKGQGWLTFFAANMMVSLSARTNCWLTGHSGRLRNKPYRGRK